MKTNFEIQSEFKRLMDLVNEVEASIKTETDPEKLTYQKYRLDALNDAIKWFRLENKGVFICINSNA